MDRKLWHPQVITTDWGIQFQSSLLTEFNHLLGVKHIRTTAYHPCANGLVEGFHRSLKTSLATRNNTRNWVDDLPLILLSLRNTIKEDLGYSAAELVFGAPLSLPGQYFSSSRDPKPTTDFSQELQCKMAKLAYTPPRHKSSDVYVPRHLQEYKFAFVRNDTIRRPLTPTYSGPLKVLSRADKHITIRRGNNKDTVSIDRVKPAFIE